MADEPRHKIVLVYVGVRLDQQGDPVDRWYQMTEEQFHTGIVPTGCVLASYGGKTKKRIGGAPGTAYVVEAADAEGQSIYPSTARYLGLWSNREQRQQWIIEHDMLKTADEAERRGIKLAAEGHLDGLVPFRDMYKKAIGRARKAAILANVISFITD